MSQLTNRSKSKTSDLKYFTEVFSEIHDSLGCTLEIKSLSKLGVFIKFVFELTVNMKLS